MFSISKKISGSSLSIFKALQTIPGVGPKTAAVICKKCGILRRTSVSSLTDKQLYSILNWAQSNIGMKKNFGDQVKKSEISVKQNHIKLKTYKGNRYSNKLPCRGQRTKTNAKTVRRQR